MNFLEETREAIEMSGHSPEDIILIGMRNKEYSCTWDEFCKIADFEYNSGHRSRSKRTHCISMMLVIVFRDNGLLERDNINGSEWWNYTRPIAIPLNPKALTYDHLISADWELKK